MPSTISPNMGLIVPTVGQEPGPTWATDLNASLGTIDQHNHASGQGVKITPLGMDINIDLNIQNNNLTQVKTVNFTSQLSSIPGVFPNLGALYVAGNELYYNDESGNVVPITNNGSVNSGAGSITGLPSGSASASYSSGNETFVWQSATSTAANMDGGSVIIREVIANAKGVTLSSPTSLAADYSLFFPAALPSSQKIVTIDSSGNIAANYVVDNSTIEIASNVIQVKNAGITSAQIAPGAVTYASLAPLNIQTTAGSGSINTSSTVMITVFTVTITTTGRPVYLSLQGDGSGYSFLTCLSAGVTFASQWLRDGATSVALYEVLLENIGQQYASNIFNTIDYSVGAGTHTYEFQWSTLPGQTISIRNLQMIAYEL